MLRSISQRILGIAGTPLETWDPALPVDCIVVLGAPLREDGQLSLAGRERVERGVGLFLDGLAPLIAFTGGAAHSQAEAPAMARSAILMGVPAEAILVEEESTTTSENARYLATLLRQKKVESVHVVSQPFHLRRGRRLLRREGFLASAKTFASVQYERPDLAWRWIAREYLAWVAHFVLPGH